MDIARRALAKFIKQKYPDRILPGPLARDTTLAFTEKPFWLKISWDCTFDFYPLQFPTVRYICVAKRLRSELELLK